MHAHAQAQETVLSSLPGTDSQKRLLLVHRCEADGRSVIELRQQSWADGVGWFTQNSVPIEPSQLGALRCALGGSSTRPVATTAAAAGFPRVVQADSA